MSSGAAALLGLGGGCIVGAVIAFFATRYLRMRGQTIGGYIRPGNASPGRPIVLSPGRRIIDPDEAEALGLTADARRMRRGDTP